MVSFLRRQESRKRAVIPAQAGIQKYGVIPAEAGIQKYEKLLVYILCSKQNGTLYTDVTSDIVKRVYEHKHGLLDSCLRRNDIL